MEIVKHRGIYRIVISVLCASVMILSGLSVAWGQTASAASVQFLSPTSFGGEVPTLTDDKAGDAGANTTYRLSAWAGNAPQGSMVEFELLPGDELTRPITIGSGTIVGGDTFEYEWDIAEGPTGVLEGPHTLKATLYDANSEELAADTMAVKILHGTSPQTSGETAIDLTYPVSGGPLGQYTASNGKTNSVLDSAKGDSSVVTAYFTTSAPGTSPVWTTCNSGEVNNDFGDGVRCTYPVDNPDTKETNEAVDPTTVTAVAIVIAREDGSADVARVLPYQQDPSAMRYDVYAPKATGTIDPDKPGSLLMPKDPNTETFPCSDWIRVKVTDQVGRTVAAANLDAHASGPSDQLKFHTSYISALGSPHLRAPEDGHSFPEQGTKCISVHDAVGPQGEHSLAGKPDNKHVETTSGTRDNGTFDFRLQTDQPGVTDLTVWSDKKNDDKFCSEEPSVALTLSWGTQGQTNGGEQPAACELVPEPPVTEAPFDGSRTSGIEASSSSVPAGRKVTVVGSLEAAEDACEIAQTLKLKAKRPSAARFRTIGSGTTDAFGLASFKVTVKRTKVYRVVAPAAGDCVRASSPKSKIRAL
ncbi:MAG: hypothetical protein M3N53_03825 [Actinomycetota bacterium]|nr:hypothetical protein [Actinomycetota bacterium]